MSGPPATLVYVDDQYEITKKYEASFKACDELLEFARQHRPPRPEHEAALIVAGTVARSDVTFKCLVKLCRLGYGEQASMLNRTLFEDMISAHWATRYPKRATRLLIRHDEWARVRRAKAYDKHELRYDQTTPLPTWWGKRRKRLQRLFGSGSWNGRSLPKMVEMVSPLWQGADRERLQRMHDVFHQGHNVLIHYSAKTLGLRVHEDADGSYTFHTGPSERFVALGLGFAFWTYANTISLGVDGDDLAALNELAAKHDAVVPDRYLTRLAAEEPDPVQS
jgi:hypothetical protein